MKLDSCDDGEQTEGDSADEALCEMLGFSSLSCMTMNEEHDMFDDASSTLPCHQFCPQALVSDVCVAHIRKLIFDRDISNVYKNKSVCQLPKELSIPSQLVRRLADEIIWGNEKYKNVKRSYETVQAFKHGQIEERRVLTRLEDISRHHEAWNLICNIYVRRLVSAIVGEEMLLFKEKLNIKPAGGSGFAPHLDTPSLRVSFGNDGPQNFVTVMIAIDDMTEMNGCLRVVPGAWNETNCVQTIHPVAGGNPDAEGRAGQISLDQLCDTKFEDIMCPGGTIVVFNGWVPHRSSPNRSTFSRRAIFLTYNPKVEGDFYERYYSRMHELRQQFRQKIGLEAKRQLLHSVDQIELDALASIPKV
jgi:ectoine hydroxylase-related dioxygenase (phytanoyl-CoA dioxygenase family)